MARKTKPLTDTEIKAAKPNLTICSVPGADFLIVVSGKVFQQNETALKHDHFLCSHKLLNLAPAGVTDSQNNGCTRSSYAYSPTE